MANLLKEAIGYSEAGLSVIPANGEKRPALPEWTPYQKQIADEKTIRSWKLDLLGVIAGQVSGGLEFLDFDYMNVTTQFFDQWTQEVEEIQPGLIGRLFMEKSPHGVHLAYRCTEAKIPGNTTLARRLVEVPGPGDHLYGHKPHTAKKHGDKWVIMPTHIETRGEGGYCVVSPSPGYELKQGSVLDLPVISQAERDTLIEVARALNEDIPEPMPTPTEKTQSQGDRRLPGQDYDDRGDIRGLLEKHGWSFKGNGSDGRERWARPGKTKGHSATLTDGKVFYVFSSNATPFESEKAYGPFRVYAILEHGGDFKDATKALAKQGYGTAPKKKGASLLDMDALQECFSEEVSWLWREHIPKGMPIIVNGREGEGKTTILVQAANEILQQHQKGIVIWIASEGFVSDTKDKMQKLNVDRQRFKILQNSNATFQFNFVTQADLRALDKVLAQCQEANTPVLAVFIDSIRGITPYDDNDSRIKTPMMGLNSIVCDKYRASLIYIHHLKKGGKDGPLLDRNTGPTSTASSVRAVYTVLPVSQFVRKIVTAKMNIYGQDPVDLMAAQSDHGVTIYPCGEKKDSTLTGQAEQWLLKIFSEHEEFLASDIYSDGEKFGFTKSVLKDAKNHLGIEAYRPNIPGPWYWKTNAFTPYSGDEPPLGKTVITVPKKPNNINKGRKGRKNFEDTVKNPQGKEGKEGKEGTFEEYNTLPSTNNNNVNTLTDINDEYPFSISKSEQKTPPVEEVPAGGISF